ncbi:MAG TPA: isocitrate/isopropylmalate dehydrogenase family protein [Planctomycetota bacterium]|jgi:isocitrate dehydrogenase (NAD+)|nr:isocitrate/isopropylmalate dehydrogenase family protein [Planctomycetota bacterium]
MRTVTLIPGDGTGPELTAAMRRVIDASGVKLKWEIADAGEEAAARHGTPLPPATLESIRRNKVAIKGPISTPLGSGYRSVNVALRKEFDLFAGIRPCQSMEGVASPFEHVNLVIVRENTEDLYAGIEHYVGKDAAESIKIVTRDGSRRIAHAAFEYAARNARRKVTIVHKANIQKLTDGMFLETARDVARDYPQIPVEDRIVDNMAMQLVQRPEEYDVLLCPNLYGDILSDLCAGLVGGLGVAPGMNLGRDAAIFEAVHGSAPQFKGLDKLNPTALILSAVLMLEHLNEHRAAEKVQNAVRRVIADGQTVTADLGGTASTTAMTDAIIAGMAS